MRNVDQPAWDKNIMRGLPLRGIQSGQRLLTSSIVPILVVPGSYRSSHVRKRLMLSMVGFEDLGIELKGIFIGVDWFSYKGYPRLLPGLELVRNISSIYRTNHSRQRLLSMFLHI